MSTDFELCPITEHEPRPDHNAKGTDTRGHSYPVVCTVCEEILEDGEHTGKHWPTGNHGVVLHSHTHEWVEVGAHRWPVGAWTLVFKCAKCGDVIAGKSDRNEHGEIVTIREPHEAAS